MNRYTLNGILTFQSRCFVARLKKPSHNSASPSPPMPKPFYKHKLLFDENMPPRTQYPRLNEYFDVKYVSHDYKKGGISDEEVYKMACRERRLIITINRDDFEKLVGTKGDRGVIAIADGPAAARTDTKLTALLMRHGPNYFRGRLIPLGAAEAKRQGV
jgi:predicted nuclease of predicted toxin-antitoxin system